MTLTLDRTLLVVILVSTLASTAYAVNCTDTSECKNGGKCDDPNNAPCNCTGTFTGDTCEEACTSDDHCLNGGTCNTGNCTCISNFSGAQCADACDDDADCLNSGMCETTKTPKTCSCKSGYSGDQCDKKGSGGATPLAMLMSVIPSLFTAFFFV